MSSQYPGSGPPRGKFIETPVNSAPETSKDDLFHGQETTAKLVARFITHRFTCPGYPPPPKPQVELPDFIAYVLRRMKLQNVAIFSALILLQRLKVRFPLSCGSSGHRLFVSACMISSGVMWDEPYSNKSWSKALEGMFSLCEINQMEREVCNYLDWELIIDDLMLANFKEAVTKDFGEDKSSYPNYPTEFVSKRAAQSEASMTSDETTAPIPGFSDSESARPIGAEEMLGFRILGVDTSPSLGRKEGVPFPHPLEARMSAVVKPSKW